MSHNAFLIEKDDALVSCLHEKLGDVFTHGHRIAIKIHMGEPGNKHYIKPEITQKIASALKDLGCNPFVFDSPVVYGSPRSSAASYIKAAAGHGYTEAAIGAPIIISDAGTKLDGELTTYHACSDLLDADGVLLLSHFKGHIASGMGGAIKNVGMGCMTKETKGAIHKGGEPLYGQGCTQCGTCIEQCPTDNIRLDADGPRFDRTWCPGCSNCVHVCPENCIAPRVATFDDLLAEAAVLTHGRLKRTYAINVLKNITKLCDCIANSGPVLIDDIGYICGEDMLTVDIASLETLHARSGSEDLFSEYNKKSSWLHVRSAAGRMNRNLDVSILTA